MMLEGDGGAWESTPAEMHVEILPDGDGFWRIQSLEGPGVILTDSLKLSAKGKPLYHIFVRGRMKTRTYYRTNEAISVTRGDTISLPYNQPFVFDMGQLDLALRGLDTLKGGEYPFMSPENGNMEFFTLETIREDSIRSAFSKTDLIPSIHRYASAPGTTHEAWYSLDPAQQLPIKMRVSTSGSIYIYYRKVKTEE